MYKKKKRGKNRKKQEKRRQKRRIAINRIKFQETFGNLFSK